MALSRSMELAAKGSTGTGRKSAFLGSVDPKRIAVEVEVEAVGATPSMTFTVQGSMDGSTWTDMQYVTLDSSVAASKAGIAVTTVGKTVVFVDGLDKRFPHFIAVNVSANTNVTFSARAYPA